MCKMQTIGPKSKISRKQSVRPKYIYYRDRGREKNILKKNREMKTYRHFQR